MTETPEVRRAKKTVMFGLMYGADAETLKAVMDQSVARAERTPTHKVIAFNIHEYQEAAILTPEVWERVRTDLSNKPKE